MRAGELALGFADVVFGGNASELKEKDTVNNIGLVDGESLPIKFRIEEGALCGSNVDCFEGSVNAGGGTLAAPSGEAGAEFPEGAIPTDGGGVNVVIERITDLPCLPTDFEQFEGCYRFTTLPELADGFSVPATVALCVEPAGLAVLEQLQAFKSVDPFDPDAAVVALEQAPADFVDCDDFARSAAARADGLLGRVAAAGARALRPLAAALVPRALWAGHEGFGSLVGSFSRVGWVRPLDVEVAAGDEQEGVAGLDLPIDPTVRVVSSHTGAPVAGVGVTFAVTGGGGTIDGEPGPLTVFSGADGLASVTWTLGPEQGDNTLGASIPGADPVTFTATGVEPPLVGFHFLSPLAGTVAPKGTFLAKLAPDVEIYLAVDGVCSGAPLATFTSGALEVNESGQHYQANWDPSAFNRRRNQTYRVRVLLAGFPLGSVDVLFDKSKNDADELADGAFHTNITRTVPIEFRIEKVE